MSSQPTSTKNIPGKMEARKLNDFIFGLEGPARKEILQSQQLPPGVQVDFDAMKKAVIQYCNEYNISAKHPKLTKEMSVDDFKIYMRDHPELLKAIYIKSKNWLETVFGKDQTELEQSYQSHYKGSFPPVPAFDVETIDMLYDELSIDPKEHAKITIKDEAAKERIRIVEGVDALELTNANLARGGIVQVASQFNALESPNIYRAELAHYPGDKTQGPMAVMPCGHALCSREFGPEFNAFSQILPTKSEQNKWVKHGYLQWGTMYGETPGAFLATMNAGGGVKKLLIPAMWAKPELGDHPVLQCYTAATPTNCYNNDGPVKTQNKIARELIIAQYKSLAKLAVIRSRQTKKTVPLHFTLVGAEAFQNEPSILRDALKEVREILKGENVDLYIHSYDPENPTNKIILKDLDADGIMSMTTDNFRKGDRSGITQTQSPIPATGEKKLTDSQVETPSTTTNIPSKSVGQIQTAPPQSAEMKSIVNEIIYSVTESATPQKYQALANLLHYRAGIDANEVFDHTAGNDPSKYLDDPEYYRYEKFPFYSSEDLPLPYTRVNRSQNIEKLILWASKEARDKSLLRVFDKFKIDPNSSLAKGLNSILSKIYDPNSSDDVLKDSINQLKLILMTQRIIKKFPKEYKLNQDKIDNILQEHIHGKRDIKSTQEELQRVLLGKVYSEQEMLKDKDSRKINTILTKFPILRKIETPPQVRKRVKDEIVGRIHDNFAEEVELLGNVQRDSFEGDEVLYRGIPKSAIPEEAIISGFDEIHRAKSSAGSIASHQIKTAWGKIWHPDYGASIASNATATSSDAGVAVNYALGRHEKADEGWVFEIRPKKGQRAVGLVNYAQRGDTYSEIDFSQVDPNEVVAVHLVKRRNDGKIDIVKSIQNPQYKKKYEETQNPKLLKNEIFTSGNVLSVPPLNDTRNQLLVQTSGKNQYSVDRTNNPVYQRLIANKQVQSGQKPMPHEIRTARNSIRVMNPSYSERLGEILKEVPAPIERKENKRNLENKAFSDILKRENKRQTEQKQADEMPVQSSTKPQVSRPVVKPLQSQQVPSPQASESSKPPILEFPNPIKFTELHCGFANENKDVYLVVDTQKDILNKPKSLFIIPDNKGDAELPLDRLHRREYAGGMAGFLHPGKTSEGDYEVHAVGVPTIDLTGNTGKSRAGVSVSDVKHAFERIYTQLGTGKFTEIVVPYEPEGYDKRGKPNGKWKPAFGTAIAQGETDPEVLKTIASEFENLRTFLKTLESAPAELPVDLNYKQAFLAGRKAPEQYSLKPNNEPAREMTNGRPGLGKVVTSQETKITSSIPTKPLQSQQFLNLQEQFSALSSTPRIQEKQAHSATDFRTPVTFEHKTPADTPKPADSIQPSSPENIGTVAQTQSELSTDRYARKKARDFFTERQSEFENHSNYDFIPDENVDFAYTLSRKKDSNHTQIESAHVDYLKGSVIATPNPSDILLMKQIEEAVIMGKHKGSKVVTLSNCTPLEAYKMIRFCDYFRDKFKAELKVKPDEEMSEGLDATGKNFMDEYTRISRYPEEADQSVNTAIAAYERQVRKITPT